MKFRYTLWEDGARIAKDLGLVFDDDSRPNIFEWYVTFDNREDSLAFGDFLWKNGKNGHAIKHGVSCWEN